VLTNHVAFLWGQAVQEDFLSEWSMDLEILKVKVTHPFGKGEQLPSNLEAPQNSLFGTTESGQV